MVRAAMRARWLLFWACLAVIAGSAVGAWAALQARAEDVRGWEQATETFDLPYRLPLAGVNVELTQYAPGDLAHELLDEVFQSHEPCTTVWWNKTHLIDCVGRNGIIRTDFERRA